MGYDARIKAIRLILMALEEVECQNGQLPPGDSEADEEGPATFMALVKQYAGNRVPESELLVAIETVAPMFSAYQFPWK